MKKIYIAGLDLSKNHYAFVMKQFNSSDKNTKICFGWNTPKIINHVKKYDSDIIGSILPKKQKGDDQANFDLKIGIYLYKRMFMDLALFDAHFKIDHSEDIIFIAIEDYAFSGNQVVQLAEITGSIKQLFHSLNIHMRLYDPLSLKMWVLKGNTEKEYIFEEARKKLYIPNYLSATKMNPACDISDAYFLMNMLDNEIRIRIDPNHLKTLSDNKLKLFNRVTKKFPVNLLNRPFISIQQPVLKKGLRKIGGKHD